MNEKKKDPLGLAVAPDDDQVALGRVAAVGVEEEVAIDAEVDSGVVAIAKDVGECDVVGVELRHNERSEVDLAQSLVRHDEFATDGRQRVLPFLKQMLDQAAVVVPPPVLHLHAVRTPNGLGGGMREVAGSDAGCEVRLETMEALAGDHSRPVDDRREVPPVAA